MLVGAAKARGEKTMVLRLAAEILDAHEGRGSAVKMRDDMHRMAKANQAFAHYRW
jgi:small subunit ribosomal protein S7